MDSSTLIYDTVSCGGKEKIPEELRSILENGRSFFVAPKDCDEIVKCATRVISNALNSAFGIN